MFTCLTGSGEKISWKISSKQYLLGKWGYILLYYKSKIEQSKRFKDLNDIYEDLIADNNRLYELFHESRKNGISIIKQIGTYLKSKDNIPINIENNLEYIKLTLDDLNKNIEYERKVTKDADGKELNLKGAVVATIGVATGYGVEIFAPRIMMTLATKVGTAGTGKKISVLHGVAQTNSILAWLGGGSLKNGGGGIKAGKELLKLSRPIGLTIGGLSLVVGGAITVCENKKIAEKYNSQNKELIQEIIRIYEINKVINEIQKEIDSQILSLKRQFNYIKGISNISYEDFSLENKLNIENLLDNTKALVVLYNKM